MTAKELQKRGAKAELLRVYKQKMGHFMLNLRKERFYIG